MEHKKAQPTHIWWSLFVGLAASGLSMALGQESTAPDDGLWYKNSIIYNLEVGTFKDSDGDGIGDFQGLIQKLGYLDSLGVDVIWLAPFNPSPGNDDGYDVKDYYTINPKFGTMDDFDLFMAEAKKKGMKVISDVVLNHTSIEHPWYEEARRSPDSRYRRWYVWSADLPDDADKGMVFPGVQRTTWSYDSIAGLYYFHRFYPFQPDLNYTNPEVQQEAFKILRFWLEQGMDGYRLDAVPFIIDVPETGSETPQRMMQLVPTMRNIMRDAKHDALMLGEANLSPQENKDYFGEDNNGMQMMFNFYVNQFLFYALATQELRLFIKAIEDTKEKPSTAQWAHFLRNHDEIDLDRLGERRREEVYAKFGPDTSMQLYGRGIRRRLAPMLGDPKQLRMAYSLLYALPGTPVIRYGEEIGMGDDLSLKERLAVRTPMQWSGAPHGGFTSADTPFRNVISHGPYGYQQVNVMQQLTDSTSLLNHIKRLIRTRKACPEIGLADFEIIPANSKYIFAVRYDYGDKSLLTIHNFSDKPQAFRLEHRLLADNQLTDLFSGQPVPVEDDQLKLDGYGYGWYRLK
ncbi:alpha-glucosidase C-terminal domain-containing protein [Parapedobacter sp. ISTM3]|uniref:alpha-amylase family protein n=1 Tax=Parapedobacter sp. ISTM3 TaxID=2800130 RepID=UPI001906DB54|nr:alpha-amylase family protein [Parapedobacter sp. ISTM3]MBK1438436.1 alpha-glucosidase C-terminal domain-containing protein [Parapedobacter sp. ISTM3]